MSLQSRLASLLTSIGADVKALNNRPFCKISGTGTTTLTTAVTTTILMDASPENVGGMADLANERIVVNKAGIWRVSGNFAFAASATGNRGIFVYAGPSATTVVVASDYRIGFATLANYLSTSGYIRLAVGDIVLLRGYQSSGGNLATVSGNNAPWLSAEWISA